MNSQALTDQTVKDVARGSTMAPCVQSIPTVFLVSDIKFRTALPYGASTPTFTDADVRPSWPLESPNASSSLKRREGYIARDQWCYNCGGRGHLGDVSFIIVAHLWMLEPRL